MGIFSGALNNGGEQLTLRDAAGEMFSRSTLWGVVHGGGEFRV